MKGCWKRGSLSRFQPVLPEQSRRPATQEDRQFTYILAAWLGPGMNLELHLSTPGCRI
jgi:hypothetical protein